MKVFGKVCQGSWPVVICPQQEGTILEDLFSDLEYFYCFFFEARKLLADGTLSFDAKVEE